MTDTIFECDLTDKHFAEGKRMSEVHVSKPQCTQDGNSSIVSAEISVAGERHVVWYRTQASVSDDVEPFVVLSLFAAMRTGLPLRTVDAVSPLLLFKFQQIQEIFHGWDRTLRIVSIEASEKKMQRPPTSGVGCFFSGGVDSFYSAIKQASHITNLIFVHGFDIPLSETNMLSSVTKSLHQAAEQLRVPLIEVESNLRSFTDRYLDWGFTHGGALASVALLLSPGLSQVFIPSSYSYADLFPWGSHPLLDPLWSTEYMTLIHDGCEATRVEKIASFATHEVALRHLRVCWEYQGGKYNCGQCEKCLRTMIALRLAGVLHRCTTFDRPLDLGEVDQMRLRTVGAHKFAEENLAALEQSARDPALTLALRDCLNNQAVFKAAEELEWHQNIATAKIELETLIASTEKLIFVDDNLLSDEVVGNRNATPFMEREGEYWGPPSDDAEAIKECERQRQAGARFLVFAWPAFWWLEFYTGLHEHLVAHYPCKMHNERLVIFDLVNRAQTATESFLSAAN